MKVYIITGIMVMLTLGLIGSALFMLINQFPGIPNMPGPPLTKACQLLPPFMDSTSGIGVIKVKASPTDSNEEYVGLSAGNFAFNEPGRESGFGVSAYQVLKCKASQALNQGHTQEAEALWNQALQMQPNDAEVLIYRENQMILDKDHPYINVIAGIAGEAFQSNNPLLQNNNLEVLQGIYTAQKRYNDEHQISIQVRVIIANFGTTDRNVGLVAQQILTAAQDDDKIKALVGLPALANTGEVIHILSSANFPIVLFTSSSSSEENNGNFFHVAATATEQGERAAQYFEQNCPNVNENRRFDCKGPDVKVFIDPRDTYSNALGSGFTAQIINDKAAGKTNKVYQLIYYDSANSQGLAEKVQTLGDSPPDLIYFAGNATNADTLLKYLPQTGKYANLRVLGGDALYEPGQYSNGNYRRLNFTTFAYPDEWNILKPQSNPPNFFCDYAKDFAGGMVDTPACSGWQTTTSGTEGYGHSRPNNTVILSHDAMEVILLGNEQISTGGLPSREQLLQSIRNLHFEGTSGQIVFGPDGNPLDKAMLILRVDEHGYTRQELAYGTF